jgi:RNA polymerase sigma-70 factor, ECF subfamily
MPNIHLARQNDSPYGQEIVQALSRLGPQARRWSRDHDDARDLLQATAERALRTAARLEPGTNATAWLRVIMHHLAVDETRRRQRDRASVLALGHLARAHQPDASPDLASPEPPALPELAHVHQTAPRLREPLRTTFELWAVKRNGYKAISRIQNIPIATVATRLMRARVQMRKLMAR